jgi:3-oxoacyl-[acyl-carrier protein] reductase
VTDTILVTGCASGIGLDLANTLAQRPVRLMATDIDIERLAAEARARGWPTDRVHCSRLDVTDPRAWETIVARAESELGPLDTLVNVAGFLHPGWVHELDVDLATKQIEINVGGVIYGTRYAAAAMVPRGRGHILNVASMAALAPIEGIAVYSASKYAVRGFSLAAAQELKRRGIAVTLVCPDAVRTPMLELQRDYEEAAMTFSGLRALEPAEVTDAILAAMQERPLEVFLPRRRGWAARAADLFPAAAMWIGPTLRRRGLKKQRG